MRSNEVNVIGICKSSDVTDRNEIDPVESSIIMYIYFLI